MYNTGLVLKCAASSLLAAISLELGSIGTLLWIFLAATVLDYITGIFAAAYHKNLASEIGLRGIIKKSGSFFVIAVALLTDALVSYSAEQFGIYLSTGTAIASIVTIWLILNEFISILENISKLNVALPPFLLSAIKLLKKQTEAVGDKLAEGGKDADVQANTTGESGDDIGGVNGGELTDPDESGTVGRGAKD